MTENRTLERLREYLTTLKDVDSRWVRDKVGYYAADGDLERTNQVSLELVDLFKHRASTIQYARMIQQAYADGCNNTTGHPSLGCVKALATIVSAAITRIIEYPEILEPAPAVSEFSIPTEPEAPKINSDDFPDKVTLKWLYEKMPAELWWKLGTVIFGAFVIGLTLGSMFPGPINWLFSLIKRITSR